MKPVYLDYAATTPVDPRVAAKMAECLTQDGVFGNPASLHVYGIAAKQAVEEAREQIAAVIHAQASELIFTSGATESNNLAIKGAARLYQRKGKHIVTMKTEHKSVLDACQHLEKEGWQVTYLQPEANGLLQLDTFRTALREDTALVSIMLVNNETGVIQDIKQIAEETSARGILLHVDAAQAAGKLAIDVTRIPIDLMSLSAHKVYGPKGIGALYLRKKPRVRVEPLIHGGGHEQGMRSGTLATHQIVGMGEAFHFAQYDDASTITQLREQFLQGLSRIPNMRINAQGSHCVPHILNVRFEGMLADAILSQLPTVAASTASACQGGRGVEGSYVLRAMGLTNEEVKSAVRFSFGRFTHADEIDEVVNLICKLWNE
jgi:cysteine desulfurase